MSDAEFSFVVLASGKGSNAEALLSHAKQKNYKALALISDRTNVPALDVAKKFGVPSFVFTTAQQEEQTKLLQELTPQWAFLAGYKKMVSKHFLDFFFDKERGYSRVLNVHPSLLPAYPGLKGYERAFRDGVKVTGVTVHLVDAGLDTGLPVLQEAICRNEEESLEDLVSKGQSVEHRLFSTALDLAAENKISIRRDGEALWASIT